MMDERRIFECLRISFDALQQDYQEMFLDIACALIGQSRNMALEAWKACGWSSTLGVRSLVEKALVTIDEMGNFHMHDHLRDMGRKIAKDDKAFRGARLWMPEAYELLKNNKVVYEHWLFQIMVLVGKISTLVYNTCKNCAY